MTTAEQHRGWCKEEWRSGGNKREQHPADWTPMRAGRWRGPKGRVYEPDTEMAQRVVQRRIKLGLPTAPVNTDYDLSVRAEAIEKAATEAGVSPHVWVVAAIDKALAGRGGAS